jgi:PAS domain S-box-containing protein
MTKPLKILAIEDSASDADLNIRQIEKAGYEVSYILADNSADMQAALEKGTFDIVLSDHNMPQFSSAGALALLQKTNLDIPFIIVSGAIGEETAVQLMKAGAQDYVMKSNLSRLAPVIERELKDAELRRDKKKSDEKLRQSEERFSQVVEVAGEMIWEADTKMMFLYANPVSELVTGYTPEEMTGKMSFYDLSKPENKEGFKTAIIEIVNNREALKGYTLDCTRKGGDQSILEINATPILNRNAELRGYRGTCTDITERKRMEARIDQLYKLEKVQTQKLQEEAEVKNIFIDVLAHELRNSLTSLVVSSDILQETPDLDNEMRSRLISNVCEGAKALGQHLDELLDLARYSKGNFELKLQTIDVREFFEQLASRYKPNLIKRNQILMSEIGGELKLVKLDKSRIEQVIINLLSNASKYSSENSEIVMKVTVEPSGLLVEVIDKGLGIPAEDQKNLFQPYYRAGKHKGIPGIGLGLAVSKKIVEAHGGKIWINSQVGQGSTFSFQIPAIP